MAAEVPPTKKEQSGITGTPGTDRLKLGGVHMEERIRRLIERFPEKADVIRALSDSNAKFKDLIDDHHDVSAELSNMTQEDRASNPAQVDELQRRRANLEEELILLMESHQRI
jgi:uncharacterized protein YdcH (DUF465 family)